jgi:hypothetical protein
MDRERCCAAAASFFFNSFPILACPSTSPFVSKTADWKKNPCV